MKKFAKVMAIAAACAALTGSVAAFSACGEGGESYQIDISGSTSMEDAMNALADKFIEMKGEEGIDLTINISATGSGSGISDAEQGKVDFGMASRALEGDETEQLESKTICLDGISDLYRNLYYDSRKRRRYRLAVTGSCRSRRCSLGGRCCLRSRCRSRSSLRRRSGRSCCRCNRRLD